MTFRTIACAAVLLGVATGAWAQTAQYDGLKKTVAVDPFQAAEAVGGTVTSDGLTAMLTTALARDGRFVVVERPGLAGVQTELTLGAAGSTTAETAAKSGQLIGAGAIVRGTVIKYAPEAGGGSLGVSGFPMSGLFGSQAGVKRQTATLTISLRLVDTTTGQVISTSSAEGSASATDANATLVKSSTGMSIGASAFSATPIGQAAQEAIVKAVDQIAAGMRKVPWSALVVDASDGKVYVNAGADRNVQAGMVLAVYRKGKVLTDPSTGVVLDIEMAKIGTIRVDAVRDRLSTAVMVDGAAPSRGDLLKLN